MTDIKITAKWIPIAQAAHYLKTTPLNVLMHVKRGHLPGVEQEDGWLVDPDSLAVLIEKRRCGELATVCQSGCGKAQGCKSCG